MKADNNNKSPAEQYVDRAITPDLPKKKMRDHQDGNSVDKSAVPFEVQYTYTYDNMVVLFPWRRERQNRRFREL